MELSATITAVVKASQSVSVGLGRPVDAIDVTRRLSLSTGSGQNQADQCFHLLGAVDSEATTTLNFADGSLSNGLGQAVEMARIKVLMLRNTSESLPLLLRGTNGIAPSANLTVLPGQFVLLATGDEDGHPTTAAATILLENQDTEDEVAFELVVIGASAAV